ncbi:MAG: EmrB/QacA subfamily drug resistance transporter [Ilumatobacteraceae bacterium]|nr:EmrB/QacA subfamily drug resistance transporter [Ilumatobacteraceae bacterium]
MTVLDDRGPSGASGPSGAEARSIHRRIVSPWWVLLVLAIAQFMDVLDVTIVNVALPNISTDLHFGRGDLQWVVSAYTLFYGGFLLLGGRMADLFGRRRMFLVGITLFGVSSLAASMAPNSAVLVAFRATQGLGGAMMTPAGLSLLLVAFPPGKDRNVALGIWGSLAGLGGTLGVVLGGVLVDSLSWRWVFLVNAPVVAVLAVVVPFVVRESRGVRVSLDIAGALLGTGGVLTIVLGVVRAENLGWSSGEVIGLLALAVGLLAAFVFVESRVEHPLLPLALLRGRRLATGSAMTALNGAGFLSVFFLSAVYLQQRLGLSALHAGLDFVPMGVAAVVSAIVVSSLITRVGTRPVQLAGAVLSVAGALLLATSSPSGSYLTELLPGFVLFGAGILAVGVPSQISAVADLPHEQSGIGSGVFNASYQVGGALGLGVITAVALSHAVGRVDPGTATYHYGMAVVIVLIVVNGVLALLSPQLKPTPEMVANAAG